MKQKIKRVRAKEMEKERMKEREERQNWMRNLTVCNYYLNWKLVVNWFGRV